MKCFIKAYKHPYRIIYLLLMLLLGPAISYGQTASNNSTENKFRFTRWGFNEGLSSGEVYDIIRDANGFIWVGTLGGGLNRFDGKSFKYFMHDPRNPKSIGGNLVTDFVEDSLHNIWMSTENGLSRLDIQMDTFSNFIPLRADSSAAQNRIVPFWSTREEVFCGERESEIVAINTRTFVRRKIFDLGEFSGNFFYGTMNHSVFDSSGNTIWMLANPPGTNTSCVLEIDLNKNVKRVYDWTFESDDPHLTHPHTAEACVFDPRHRSLWINSTEGLLEFNLDNRQFRLVNIAAALTGKMIPNEYYGRNVGIDQDSTGRIWFVTEKKGIIVYDPGSQTAFFPFSSDSLQYGYSGSNAVVYCDQNQMVWTGSWSKAGMARLTPYSPYVTSNRSVPEIWAVSNAPSGKLFMSSVNGIYLFNPATGESHPFDLKNTEVADRNKIIIAKYDSSRNKVWYIQENNLFVSDLRTGLSSKVGFRNEDGQEIKVGPLGLREFRDGLLCFLKQENSELINYLEPDSLVAHTKIKFQSNHLGHFLLNGISDNWIFLHTTDPHHNLSVKIQGDRWAIAPSPLDTMFWSRIYYERSDKSYWISRFQELLHFDSDFRVLKKFNLDDGLPEIDIYGMVTDLKGNLWFNTDRAIYYLNHLTGKIGQITALDGYRPTTYKLFLSPFRDARGDIYFHGGDARGFDRIRPDKNNETHSQVYIRSIRINDENYNLDSGFYNTQVIDLRYYQNRLTFETGIIDYFTNGATTMRYKLEGLFDNWQYEPYYATIRFDNLAPKNYRLILESSDANGEFKGPTKIIELHIKPAFWDTWWFQVSFGVFMLAIGYATLRYFIRRKYRIKVEKLEREKEIAELRHRSTEMEMQALRSQMNPHFIFNSLNSINRFILQNERLQASEYLTKFSRLVRLILQNSQASLITLESELETLKLYLELEALRFENRFLYKISTEDELDREMLKVPPLIIQPYVENAIWHGLMHKEGLGQLDIEVTEVKDHLFFRVADNGIGRKKAAEFSSKSATKHKSMGLKITENRITMMNQLNGKESPVKINDLVNPDGSAAGTEVIITLPVLYN